MARVASMAVVYLLALLLTTSSAAAIDCRSAASSILPCSNFLRDPNPTAPGSSCCSAAGNLLRLGDAESLCACLNPLSSGFLQSKVQQLSDLCNLNAFSSLAGCLGQATDKPESFLPPVGPISSFPFPPVFPLPPFNPLPPFSLLPPISFLTPPSPPPLTA